MMVAHWCVQCMALSERQLLDALSRTPFVDSTDLALTLGRARRDRPLRPLGRRGAPGPQATPSKCLRAPTSWCRSPRRDPPAPPHVAKEDGHARARFTERHVQVVVLGNVLDGHTLAHKPVNVRVAFDERTSHGLGLCAEFFRGHHDTPPMPDLRQCTVPRCSCAGRRTQ